MSDSEEVLTLEPLIEAMQAGVEEAGWRLSGLQKTTSHQFEGRWEGESTRSAYLFFHKSTAPEFVSVDVYLDETSRGLTGNLALVVDLRSLGELGDAVELLRELADISTSSLPTDRRTPLTLRLRLADPTSPPAEADVEVRFKLRIPRASVDGGRAALRRLARSAVEAFETILASDRLARLT